MKGEIRQLELKTDGDLKVMRITFHNYATKDLIEVDARVKSTDNNLKILNHLKLSLDHKM